MSKKLKLIILARLDDKLTAWILDKFLIFKYINPNSITIAGFLMNFAILYFVTHGMLILSLVFLLFRYLADCLDGGVARKYNKKSKLGGVLDTWSDTILIYVSIVGLFYVYNLSFASEFAAFFSCLNLYIMSLSNSLIDHEGMKSGGGFFSDIYSFFINNSFIPFIIMGIAISTALL